MTMIAANSAMPNGEKPGDKHNSDNGFLEALAGARDESAVLKQQGPDRRLPRAAQEAACTDMYNEAAAIANGVVLRLLVEGTEVLRGWFANPDNRAVVEESLDRLDDLLNALEHQCGDFLPASAMEEVRGMRETLERLREAMRMNLWEQVQSLAGVLWEGLKGVGHILRSIGADVLRLIPAAAEGVLRQQNP
ncbi:hypothetical protein [Saliniramus sp.]|uniref:hypothetical protein n=1 Tax=Saliniramus sp. TaxID=2986772 RepID=UPI002BCDD9F4|nr:hypothetical protein [Saliniramus sp.]HMB11427.1 hypothetical protein [Saliniramus sp.]